VLGDGRWQANRYEGYRALAIDITAFWRPRLQGWKGKFGLGHRSGQRAYDQTKSGNES
jgi:hypothetical protein